MRYSEETQILALDVRHSRIGYALFVGPRRLLDWGVNTVPAECRKRAEWIQLKMAELLRRGSPACVVTRPQRLMKLPSNAIGVPILKAIRSATKEHGIPMYVLGRDEIQSAFRTFHVRTKEEIASAIVGIFPELIVRLPLKRKKWQPEAHGMIVFDAIATGIAYWQRKFPSI